MLPPLGLYAIVFQIYCRSMETSVACGGRGLSKGGREEVIVTDAYISYGTTRKTLYTRFDKPSSSST